MEVERLDQSCTFQILKLKTKIGSKCCELFPNCLKQQRLQYWLTFCLTICCNQPQVRDRWQMVYLWLVAPIIAKKHRTHDKVFFIYMENLELYQPFSSHAQYLKENCFKGTGYYSPLQKVPKERVHDF